MRTRLLHLWDVVRTSLWFLPAAMTAGGIGLALLMLHLDEIGALGWLSDAGWVYSRSAVGARDLLGVVAGSMITIAGLAFSIIVVALQLASAQLGTRLLRNFTRDLGNQAVLGTFIATFVYCLMVMRTIDGGVESAEARLSVVMALVLAVASLGVLIYFIHHTAESMQAPTMIAALSAELRERLDELYPESIGEGAPSQPAPSPPPDAAFAPVQAEKSGYLQRVDDDGVMEAAGDCDVIVRLLVRPGDFVVRGGRLAAIWPATRANDVASRVRKSCLLGGQRTPEQDIGFTIDQLVEVGMRALSTGRNDLFTTVSCIEHLSAILVELSRRRLPSSLRTDAEGRLRVIAPRRTAGEFIESAFGAIRSVRPELPAVQIALLEALERVGRASPDRHTREAVRRQVRAIASDAQLIFDVPGRRVAARKVREVLTVLRRGSASGLAPDAHYRHAS